MTKEQFIDCIAKDLKISSYQSRKIVNVVFARLKEEVKSGKDVKIVKFGVFFKTKRKAKDVRLPSGKFFEIPAQNVPKFRAYPPFKELVK